MDNAENDEVTLDLKDEPELEAQAKPEPAKVEQAADANAEADPAAEAFARLEGEMALVRRAVQHLAAERADIVIPDYGTTLTEMTKRLGAIAGSLDDIAGHPAMQVTPDSFGRRIEAAAETARRGDQGRINDAHNALQQAAQDMRTVTAHARTSSDQRRSLFKTASGSVLAGILLCSFLPGTIARAVPESWQWPERMAARMIGESSRWDAGARLMRTDSPEAWEAIADAATLSEDNADAIERCKTKARKANHPVDCKLRVGR